MFGSLFGFTAYVWLMRVSTPARVSTISYVNIVVAVAIGCTFGGEPLTWRLALGAGIIVGSVVLVLMKPSAATRSRERRGRLNSRGAWPLSLGGHGLTAAATVFT